MSTDYRTVEVIEIPHLGLADCVKRTVIAANPNEQWFYNQADGIDGANNSQLSVNSSGHFQLGGSLGSDLPYSGGQIIACPADDYPANQNIPEREVWIYPMAVLGNYQGRPKIREVDYTSNALQIAGGMGEIISGSYVASSAYNELLPVGERFVAENFGKLLYSLLNTGERKIVPRFSWTGLNPNSQFLLYRNSYSQKYAEFELFYRVRSYNITSNDRWQDNIVLEIPPNLTWITYSSDQLFPGTVPGLPPRCHTPPDLSESHVIILGQGLRKKTPDLANYIETAQLAYTSLPQTINPFFNAHPEAGSIPVTEFHYNDLDKVWNFGAYSSNDLQAQGGKVAEVYFHDLATKQFLFKKTLTQSLAPELDFGDGTIYYRYSGTVTLRECGATTPFVNTNRYTTSENSTVPTFGNGGWGKFVSGTQTSLVTYNYSQYGDHRALNSERPPNRRCTSQRIYVPRANATIETIPLKGYIPRKEIYEEEFPKVSSWGGDVVVTRTQDSNETNVKIIISLNATYDTPGVVQYPSVKWQIIDKKTGQVVIFRGLGFIYTPRYLFDTAFFPPNLVSPPYEVNTNNIPTGMIKEGFIVRGIFRPNGTQASNYDFRESFFFRQEFPAFES